MKMPVELFLSVANIGGEITIAGDKLRMLLPGKCRPELKDSIRQHKSALLKLTRLTFLSVRSDILNTAVFFVPDDATRQSLILAGAKPGNIYTKAELGILVARRITPTELRLIHAGKQQFNGEVKNR
jgi:hypothetical protein